MRWERLKKSETMEMEGGPGKRWGHTCNAIRGGKLFYVFGGYGNQNSQTNQVHVFDTDAQTWSEPVVKGTPPTPRDSHTCTTVGDNLFVFGGTDGLNPLGDLHILDTTSNTWISPRVRGDGPEAREGHSATLVGKRLFIFGGCGKSMNRHILRPRHYNDLYVLDTETFVWQRAVMSGNPPAARDSHSCSSWKNKIIVIGGEDEQDYYLSNVHVLDTDTLVWRELMTSGHMLTPRAGHTAVAFGKHIFVFGGFTDAQDLYDDLYMLDLETAIWTKIMPSGDRPSSRFSMSGDCLDPSKGGVLAFIGGCNKNLEALDDVYYLHTELVRDDGRDDGTHEQRLEKLSFRKQLKMKCLEQYISTSENDKALATYGQQGQQYFHLNMYQPPTGKRTFQAIVTKKFASGYNIETVIDGKPLRGILFSTSTASSTANLNSDGKKDSGVSESKLKGNQDPITKCSTPDDPQSKLEGNQDPITRCLTSDEPHTEAADTPPLKKAKLSNEGLSQEVANTESENLMVSNADSEVDKTDRAPASENLATPENPSMDEVSATLPTNQDGQVGTSDNMSS